MTTDAHATRDVYTDVGELRGVWTRGAEPKELVLSDGSRLMLEDADQGPVLWRRTECSDGDDRSMSVAEALEVAGDDFRGYVTVRTRAEAAHLRSVAEWCGAQAERLEHELDGGGRGR